MTQHSGRDSEQCAQESGKGAGRAAQPLRVGGARRPEVPRLEAPKAPALTGGTLQRWLHPEPVFLGSGCVTMELVHGLV